MRSLLAVAALAVFAPATADAHECGHGFVFDKEGPFCPQRGRGYWVPALRFELGAVGQQIVIDDDDARDSGLTPGAVAARGGRLRFSYGAWGAYLGGELTLGTFDGVAMQTIARGTIAPGDPIDGRFAEITSMLGMRRATGRLIYGLELAGGLRNAWFDGAPPERTTMEGVLDVRTNVGVWLSPFLSVSAQVGQSLVARDEHHVMLAFGVSVFPWDGLR